MAILKNTINIGDALVTGDVIANSLIKQGGTNKQILLADGTTKDLGTGTTTYLRNDGLWTTPPDNNTTYSIAGTSPVSVTASGSNPVTVTISHANSGVTAGKYGSSTQVPVFTVSATGHITAVSNVAISQGTYANTAASGNVGATNSTWKTPVIYSSITAAHVLSGSTTSYPAATTTSDGYMTSTLATKLNNIDTGATKNTITLNGTVTASPSFYAPTGAGTSGYFLRSNGSGAPIWSYPIKYEQATSNSWYPILMASSTAPTSSTYYSSIYQTDKIKINPLYGAIKESTLTINIPATTSSPDYGTWRYFYTCQTLGLPTVALWTYYRNIVITSTLSWSGSKNLILATFFNDAYLPLPITVFVTKNSQPIDVHYTGLSGVYTAIGAGECATFYLTSASNTVTMSGSDNVAAVICYKLKT